MIPEGYTIFRDIEVMRLPYAPPRNRIRMDLWAPASPRRPVPLVLELSATATEKHDTEMKLFNFNTPYLAAYAFFGYAAAVTAFVYEEPEAPGKLALGLDSAERKAIRMLRARKSEWGVNGKIGLCGISKSSSRALLTAAKRPFQKASIPEEKLNSYPYSVFYKAAMPAWLVSEYAGEINDGWFPYKDSDAVNGVREERELGPYAEESDCPDVIHCAAGGPMEFPNVIPYLTEHLPPVVFNIGKEDGWEDHRVAQVSAILTRDALKDAGVKNMLYIEQEKLGHAFNHIRFDEIKRFFDAVLKKQ